MIVVINATAQPAQNSSDANELSIKKADFPNDFVFGVSTAAAQVHFILVMMYDTRSSKIIHGHVC